MSRMTIWPIALALLFTGCALQRTHQPFHMYSTSMLEYQADHRDRQRQQQQAYAQRQGNRPTAKNSAYASKKQRYRPKRNRGARASRSTPRTSPKKQTHQPSLSATRRTRMPSPRQHDTQHNITALLRARKSDITHAAHFVWAMYKANNRSLPASTQRSITALFKHCKRKGVISFKHTRIGDIIFFHNTMDANGDDRNNDWYTHVGIAIDIDDKTVVVASYQDGRVHRTVLNTKHPGGAWLHGQRINSQLRPKQRKDLPFTQYMAGELYAGSCSILPRQRIDVNLRWRP